MHVIVVGINPMDQVHTNGKNHTLTRLSRWMPVRHFSFVNCIPHVVGPVYKPSQSDYKWVRKALITGYDRVVCLGPLPSRVLTNMGVEHFVLPHPSGRNRLLNDPAFEGEMVSRLRRFVIEGHWPVRDGNSIIGTVQGGQDYNLFARQHRPAHRRRGHRFRPGLRDAPRLPPVVQPVLG